VHAAVKLICRYQCNQLRGNTQVRDYLNYASVRDVNLIKVSFTCRPAELITPDTFRTAVPQAAPTSLQTHTGVALFICECDHIEQVVDARQVSIKDIWRRCAITQRTHATDRKPQGQWLRHSRNEMKWNRISRTSENSAVGEVWEISWTRRSCWSFKIFRSGWWPVPWYNSIWMWNTQTLSGSSAVKFAVVMHDIKKEIPDNNIPSQKNRDTGIPRYFVTS